MYISRTFPTAAGHRRIDAPNVMRVVLSEGEVELLASALIREADTALRAGLLDLCRRMEWRASALRETARIGGVGR